MRLRALQRTWMIGTGLFFAVVMLDIFRIIDLPPPLLVIPPILLLLLSLAVGPSLKDVKRMSHRG